MKKTGQTDILSNPATEAPDGIWELRLYVAGQKYFVGGAATSGMK